MLTRRRLVAMIQLATRERVDAYWSGTLGVDPSDLHAPGSRVRPHPPDRAAWRGVYVLAFDKAACVFVPPDLLPLANAVAAADADALLDPWTWHRLLGPGVVSAAQGPVLHHYRDHRDGLDMAAGRRLNPRDAEALAALRGAVPSEEWARAGFAVTAAMLFGLFEREHMVAAANLTDGPDAATDVAVVVLPQVRRRGYGLRIAAAATRQALLMHGVARLRAPADSPPALAIAARLGFTAYGRNLALYLA